MYKGYFCIGEELVVIWAYGVEKFGTVMVLDAIVFSQFSGGGSAMAVLIDNYLACNEYHMDFYS